nr:hypothetical protein [Marinicella sp. W31]MDC2876065.1 hypothetical protein [Marinicella sp. W31]
MRNVIERLYSSIVLPMHRTGPRVRSFADMMGEGFEVVYSDSRSLTLSLRTLSSPPKIVLLDGVW